MTMFWRWIIYGIIGTLILSFGVLTQLKSTRGRYGEILIRLILKTLPQEYRVFNDVQFNVGHSRCQIDHLVVSPYGIFVIETKSYLGLTIGSSAWSMWRRYVLGKSYNTKSPIIQNQRHVELLKAKYPEIGSCLNEAVKSVVVFGFGSIIRMKDNAQNVMTIFSLYRYIRGFSRKVLTERQYQTIRSIIGDKRVYHSITECI